MDVNFCIPELTKSVKSSAITCDGYEVENLISGNFCKKRKGFLAETFIKPPVILTFEFVCDVSINYIVIHSNVGAQKSVGVEVLTSVGSQSGLNSVVSSVIKNGETGFVFYRHGCDIRKKIPINNYVFCTFTNSRNLVTNILNIKIFKTFGSSIPALGKVEVWGKPGYSCPQNVCERVYNRWKQQISPYPFSSETKVISNNKCKDEPDFGTVSSTDFKIPDEFLDPITCEIMVLPIILPSGKIIDKFTLEKHNESESHWGRSPSDPFTGILFSETNKPVLADDLKARIDKFLCENSDVSLLKDVPRTVGRKTVHCDIKQTPSTGCRHHENRNNYGGSSQYFTTKNSSPECSNDIWPYSKNSEQDRTLPVVDTKPDDVKPSDRFIHPQRRSLVSKNVKFFPYKCSTVLPDDDTAEKSLDNMLKTALSSLPSLSRSSLKDTIFQECLICKDRNNLFQTPCVHVVCRTCLIHMVNQKQLKCKECRVTFKTSDVRRVHT